MGDQAKSKKVKAAEFRLAGLESAAEACNLEMAEKLERLRVSMDAQRCALKAIEEQPRPKILTKLERREEQRRTFLDGRLLQHLVRNGHISTDLVEREENMLFVRPFEREFLARWKQRSD